MRRSARVLGVVAVVVAALALSFVPATAVAPVAGATYKGQVAHAPDSENAVAFKVSKHAGWVTDLTVGPYPMSLSCGSGGDAPDQSSAAARIRSGKFTAHVVYSSSGGDVVARATVTGTFLRKGAEKGVVTTQIVGFPDCHFSRPYTAQAQ